MYNILVIAFGAILVTMARKGRSGRRRNFIAIPFDVSLTLGTLNSGVVLSTGVLTFGEDLFIISVDAAWALDGFTATEGPLSVGWAHGDLTVAEVAEAIDASVTDPDDIIARERARRPVRKVGTFAGLSSDEVLFDGRQERRAVRFSVGDGHSLNAYVVNRSGGNLTTGSVIRLSGVIYGRWQR